jgi:hypothetical protein
MVLYNCTNCNFATHIVTHYNRHLKTDKHIKSKPKVSIREAKSKPEHNTCKNEIYTCEYCNKKYKHKQSLSKHIKYTCTENKDEDLKELVRLLNAQLEQQRNEFQSQLQTQAKQIDKLMGKLEINGSFNTTNIQNNIQILSYKDTDVSHLTHKDYEACIKKVNFCVKNLIERIHFNPEKPENMNIYISNMKDKYLMIYDGINWNLANKREELDKLYETKEMMLEEWLETSCSEHKDKFMKYLNNKEDDETLNMIKEEIKLMMYNKKQLTL